MSVEFDQIVGDASQSAAPARPKRQLKLTLQPKRTAPRRLPQVSLLPGEIRDAGQERRVRLALASAVLVALVATGGAVAAAGTAASDAQTRSTDATGRLQAANAQLAKFKEVQALQQHIALGEAAVRVGSSTAIDWQRWTGLVLADMPAGFVVQSITADSATPSAAYAQGTSPLERPRAATVVVTAQTPSLLELPIWLRKLKGLPAYADLSPAVSHAQSGYTVQVTVHLTSAAFVTPPKGQ